MIEYGMNLNVTQSKAKFIIQMAGRPLIPLKVDQCEIEDHLFDPA